MITLPVDIEIPTHIPNEFKKRTYPEAVNPDGSNIYCDNYSFADLERAWNKAKQQ
jgi:hypothetical protein